MHKTVVSLPFAETVKGVVHPKMKLSFTQVILKMQWSTGHNSLFYFGQSLFSIAHKLHCNNLKKEREICMEN